MIVNFIAYFLICLFFLSEMIKANNSMSTHSKQVVLETDEHLSQKKRKCLCIKIVNLQLFS